MATTTIPPTTASRRPTRWRTAACVALAAATIATVHAWDAAASSSGDESSFVPTAPCRLFDTRPGADPAGGKKTPLGPGAGGVHTQQVSGTVGNCAIPTSAVAVSMNVTAVGGTSQSNLRVYPADVATPTASNLNWVAGQSPTPNKVDVQLSPDGKVKLYNHNGTVDVLADVVGYYTPNALHEMRARLDEVEAARVEQRDAFDSLRRELDAQRDELDAVHRENDRLTTSMPFVQFAEASAAEQTTTTPKSILDVEVAAPVAGRVTISYAAITQNVFEGDQLICNVYPSNGIPTDDIVRTEPGASSILLESTISPMGSVSGSRTFEIAAGSITEFALACESQGTPGAVWGRSLSATFAPAP